ncbi:MAG: hypothetical protein DCF27_01040 [Lysobacteraceae bacterium]|nr:MAG: hypothetical protein DCF27_01040 [Xanthomonadaceae bacterium]
MKSALFAFALVLAAPAFAAAPAATETAPSITDPTVFADALDACTVATHAAPHPFVRGFVIEHAIAGELDGACAYSQTMPGGMRMECKLSQAGRSGMAGEYREQAAGRMSGSSRTQPAWARECEIVTKDGNRSPMGGG